MLDTDLVAFIDDDDRWIPDKLEEQLRLVASSDALVSCDYEVVPQRGRTETFRVPRDLASFRQSLLLEPTLPPSTVLAGRKLLLSVGGFDPDQRMMEDWDLWLRVIDAVDFQVVARVMVHKRAHQGQSQQIRDSRRIMRGRLQPYVAEMSPGDRARFEAHHDVMDALLAIETGHRWSAFRTLMSSMRRSPSRIGLQGIARAVVGETIWQRVQRVKRGRPLRD
jgi:hypothetical protein